jgi:hypothetical protein
VPADAAELLSLATGTEVTPDDIVVGSGPRQANSRPRPNAPRGCTDFDQLDEWVRRAVVATSADELFV